MRVLISVDMEGVAGIATLDQIIRGGSGYPHAQRLMTEEANAAARGALAAGADEVVVNDSHGTMDNLLLDDLDSRVRLVHGAPRPSCMVQGLRPGDALAVFVGYHAGAGSSGVLAHTFSSNFTELRINGAAATEAEVNALLAAELEVPIGVLTGDDEVCAVARKAFPGVRTVTTKLAQGFATADSMHPAAARAEIEAAVHDAVREQATLRPVSLPEVFALEVDFATPLAADLANSVPASTRLGPRTLGYQATDVAQLIRAIMAFYYLSGLAAQQWALLAQRR